MEITSNRIPATPRSKYARYGYGGTVSVSNGSANIDTSNFVKLTGMAQQIVAGNLGATGDVIAYSTGTSSGGDNPLKLPIASTTSLGCIKVGEDLTITEDGTLNAEAGGGVSSWNDLTDKPSTFPSTWEQITGKPNTFTPSLHTHLMEDITDFNGVTIDTAQTITGQKTFTQNIIGQADVIAYSTGEHDLTLPIASKTALGCIKVGNNLTITEDGTLNAEAGGGITSVSWEDILNKPSFATVATSGSYNDLLNKPTIPSYDTATNTRLGLVKIGSNIGYKADGTILVMEADTNIKGVVQIGSGINVDNGGVISVTPSSIGAATASHTHSNYALTSHTHSNYVKKAGDTMTGNLLIKKASSDYNYLRCINSDNQYIQFSCQPGGGGVIQDECNDSSHIFIIQVGMNWPNNVQFCGGNITARGDITAYSSSDKRLKQGIMPLNDSLDLLASLKPVSFKWNEKAIELDRFKNTNDLQFGLIAQEVEKVMPDLVHNQYQDKDGTVYKSIDYVKFVPFLIKAVQELNSKINELSNTKTEIK